jgi:hypothetical protein
MGTRVPADSLRQRFHLFRFTHRVVEGRRIRLGYALAGPDEATIGFEETLDLPDSLGPLRPASEPAAQRALLGLHLAGGPSYWKTCIPSTLALEDGALSREDAAFWTDVYTKGLGEFFFRNSIDPTGRVVFPAAREAAAPSSAPACEGPALLLWGGGKDSVVSHEALAAAGEPHELLTIGRPGWEWVRRSAEVARSPHHVVLRRIDPRVFELNAAGALNGHVPVSAYLAFAGLLVGLLTGRRAVIASNESSASIGNAVWHGIEVNHQWSKSLEFERLVRGWTERHLAGGPEYVSLLRPLTELRIMKAFASHPAYFETVTSCNRNFSQTGPAARRWCLGCPKCVFVSLMARPWLDDEAYRSLFGGDALADPANCATVEELLGLRELKPFDCVGTPEEARAAFHLAKHNGRSVPHGSMTIFAERAASAPEDLDAAAARVLARSDDHLLSDRWLRILDAYLDRH